MLNEPETKAIQNVAVEMRSSPYGAVILTAIIILVSTPPLLGFTFFVTLSGFVYGFPLGAIPAVSGKYIQFFSQQLKQINE